MRAAPLPALAAAFALAAMLGACQAGDPGDTAGDPLAGYVLDDPPAADAPDTDAPAPDAAAAAPASEPPAEPGAAGAGPDAPPDAEAVAEEPEPDPFAAARAACEREGGTFGRAPGGAGARACYRTPRDANRPCRTGADCEGDCLARSRTCAPVIPLLGCHEVVLSSGIVAEQCVQ